MAGTFESGLLVPNIQNPKRIMILSILPIQDFLIVTFREDFFAAKRSTVAFPCYIYLNILKPYIDQRVNFRFVGPPLMNPVMHQICPHSICSTAL